MTLVKAVGPPQGNNLHPRGLHHILCELLIFLPRKIQKFILCSTQVVPNSSVAVCIPNASSCPHQPCLIYLHLTHVFPSFSLKRTFPKMRRAAEPLHICLRSTELRCPLIAWNAFLPREHACAWTVQETGRSAEGDRIWGHNFHILAISWLEGAAI